MLEALSSWVANLRCNNVKHLLNSPLSGTWVLRLATLLRPNPFWLSFLTRKSRNANQTKPDSPNLLQKAKHSHPSRIIMTMAAVSGCKLLNEEESEAMQQQTGRRQPADDFQQSGHYSAPWNVGYFLKQCSRTSQPGSAASASQKMDSKDCCTYVARSVESRLARKSRVLSLTKLTSNRSSLLPRHWLIYK